MNSIIDNTFSFFKENFINEYSKALPLLFIFIAFVIFSKVPFINRPFFKNAASENFSIRLGTSLLNNYKRSGWILLCVATSIVTIGYIFENAPFHYFGVLLSGLGFAFLSFKTVHDYLMPGTKRWFNKKNTLVSYENIFIFIFILFYFFIDYFQLIWKSLKEDPDGEGLKRYVFYYSGMALYKLMNILLILRLGRNKINMVNVILLSCLSLWFVYDFIDYLSFGSKSLQYSIFFFLTAFSSTVYFLENKDYFIKNSSSN